MAINLDKGTQRLIDQELQAGRFRDAAALVSAAVRHFLITREDLGYTREEIGAMIAQSIASLERGEGGDGEEFFSELERQARPTAPARVRRFRLAPEARKTESLQSRTVPLFNSV